MKTHIDNAWDRVQDPAKALLAALLALAIAIIIYGGFQLHTQNTEIANVLNSHTVPLNKQAKAAQHLTTFEKESVELAYELVQCAKAGFGSPACAALPNIPPPVFDK